MSVRLNAVQQLVENTHCRDSEFIEINDMDNL